MNFLKKIFKKKEEKKEISFNELSSWLTQNIEFSLDNEITELKKAIIDLEANTKNLETAEIKDKPGKRIETAVKTNKKTYVTALKTLLNKLEAPKQFDSEYLNQYIKDFQDRIKNFNKRTLRNYHIIKTLIGKELEDIAISLRTVDSSIKKIKESMVKYNLKGIEEIHKNLSEIDEIIIKNKQKEKKTEELKKSKDKTIKQEKEISKKIENLKNSNEFNQYKKLKEQKEEILNKITKANSKFLTLYSPLERSLRKLLKGDKILENLKDPQKFFLENSNEFKEILTRLKQHIDRKQIVLKKPEKTKKDIDSLKNYLEDFKKLTTETTTKLEITQTAIDKNQFKENLANQTDNLKQIENKILEIEKEFQENKKEEIQERVKIIEKNLKKLGHDLKIKNVALD